MKIIEDKYNKETKCRNCESVFTYNIMDEKPLYGTDIYNEEETEIVKRKSTGERHVFIAPGAYVKCPFCGEPMMTRHPNVCFRKYVKRE